jgi:hypothetical protein
MSGERPRDNRRPWERLYNPLPKPIHESKAERVARELGLSTPPEDGDSDDARGMSVHERRFLVSLTIWGGIFGTGLYALVEHSWWFGGAFTAAGLFGLLALIAQAQFRQIAGYLNPPLWVAVSISVLTWIFLGWNIWLHFYPAAAPPDSGRTVATLDQPLPKNPTLHDYWLRDFGKNEDIQEFFAWPQQLVKENVYVGTFPLQMGVYVNWDSNSIFASFYIPASDFSYDLATVIADHWREYLDDNRKKLHVYIRPRGDSHQPLTDSLELTGIVYVYCENIFTDAQIQALTIRFNKSGALPVFRSAGYLEYRSRGGK